MQLTPKGPPGHCNRKARAFGPEIARLRSEGYSCKVIRAALADIGVDVSLSTVQREVLRCSKGVPSIVAGEASLVSPIFTSSSSPNFATPGLAGDPRSAKEIAADFVGRRLTNPLLRGRTKHEGRGH